MARNVRRTTWRVDVDGRPHEVVLNWTYWGGKREVVLDGDVVAKQRKPLLWWSEQAFRVDGQACRVVTRAQKANTLEFDAELFVGDTLVRAQSDTR